MIEHVAIEYAASDRIAVLTLTNPARLNALTIAMWVELERAVTRLSADPTVLVLIIRGAGKDFSSGFDIHDLPTDDPEEFHPVHLAAERAIASCPKPVLAAIRGNCVGGGCEIAVAADLRFAAPDARFGVTPSRLGIVYPRQPTQRLTALIGIGETRRLLFGGELMDAAWALRVGLITEIVAADRDVFEHTLAYATLLTTRSQISIAAAKHYTGGGADEVSWPATDYAEGVRAFRERRSPTFPSSTT